MGRLFGSSYVPNLKERLLQHEIVARPWAKLAAVLCELHGRTLLVVSNYFSNYIEVVYLCSTTTQAVVFIIKYIVVFIIKIRVT